ncbi:methyltransferase domain-containing protein [Streptomyces alkaliphilus]|uniref:Methyltransferase domain-containing protein n=1 Tax=Streptomyces alkaliphilus TaxID=1472722 RepID=A0A7W3THX9_9ACTN|nr:methyltransferase domain-containing protein [Streptomyces alkaliphilus]MBB0247156.1 methyltransferase domain-containing protein [Streptomyces alkaliphilus]
MSPEPTAPGPHTTLRTGVVWDLLEEALERRVAATGRSELAVLDAGGGSGSLAVRVAAGGHRVTVVDPSPDALFALRRRAAEKGVAERIRGVQGDTGDLLEVAGDGHDLVLCHGVLEYVEDPAAGMRAIARALAPGGIAGVLVAGMGGAVLARALGGRFAEARAVFSDTSPEPAPVPGGAVPHRFTEPGLAGLAEAAGLVPTAVHGVRIFADLVPGALVDSEPDALRELSRLEREAASHPAFRAIAAHLHLVAEKPAG